MSIKIIALSGKQGSGKSTFAKYIVDKYQFKRIPLAKRLKEIVRDEFGIIHPKDYEDYYKESIPEPKYMKPVEVYNKLIRYIPNKKELSNTIKGRLKLEAIKISWYINEYVKSNNIEDKAKYSRMIYQFVGTEFFRTVDKDFWINQLIETIDYEYQNNNVERFVIDDLRFPNEYEHLKNIFRDNFNLIYVKSNIENITNNSHASEKYLEYLKNKANYIIENTYNDDYFKKIDEIIQTLISPLSNHQLVHD